MCFFLRDAVGLLYFFTAGLIDLTFASSHLLFLGSRASQSLPWSVHSSFGRDWRVAQVFSDELGLHEWDATQLLVVDGLYECVLWRAKKCLMHELHLILEVGQCMDIVCRMIDSLVWQ